MKFEIKTLKLKNGEEVTSVATFNHEFSHIVVDDSVWVVANGEDGKLVFSSWIFPEAIEVLKSLPDDPLDYKPYTDSIWSPQ